MLWALGAMVGAATYFVISADEDNGLPGITLAAGGLLVGGVVLLARRRAVGVLPFHASTADAVYDGRAVAWWIPVVALGLVTAAFSYVTGIAAGRRLGSRLASFVALGEVLPPSSGPGCCSASCPAASSWPVACWCWPASSWSSWGRAGLRCWSSRCPRPQAVSERPAA